MEIEKLQENFMKLKKAKAFYYLGENLKVLKSFKKNDEGIIISKILHDGLTKCCFATYRNIDILFKKEFIKKLDIKEEVASVRLQEMFENYSFGFGMLVFGADKITDNSNAIHFYILKPNGALKEEHHFNNMQDCYFANAVRGF